MEPAERLSRSVFVIAKIVRKTKYVRAEEMDFHTEVDIISKYEAVLEAEQTGEPGAIRKAFEKVFF